VGNLPDSIHQSYGIGVLLTGVLSRSIDARGLMDAPLQSSNHAGCVSCVLSNTLFERFYPGLGKYTPPMRCTRHRLRILDLVEDLATRRRPTGPGGIMTASCCRNAELLSRIDARPHGRLFSRAIAHSVFRNASAADFEMCMYVHAHSQASINNATSQNGRMDLV
jgi:hypothetical protein